MRAEAEKQNNSKAAQCHAGPGSGLTVNQNSATLGHSWECDRVHSSALLLVSPTMGICINKKDADAYFRGISLGAYGRLTFPWYNFSFLFLL